MMVDEDDAGSVGVGAVLRVCKPVLTSSLEWIPGERAWDISKLMFKHDRKPFKPSDSC